MEGMLKNVINVPETPKNLKSPKPPETPKKRKYQDAFNPDLWYRSEEGLIYPVTIKNEKPPDPITDDFDWVWWDLEQNGSGKWIQMYNNVFDDAYRSKSIFYPLSCGCM